MKIKVGELEGVALDYAVAVAGGGNSEMSIKMVLDGFSPTTDWGQCGPMIDIRNIDFCCEWEAMHCATMNTHDGNTMVPDWYEDGVDGFFYGSTKLEAACRAIVGNLLGEEIEIPDELAG